MTAKPIAPCVFCHHESVYVDSHVTKGSGLEHSYVAQVRCRKCLARGPAVKFKVPVEPGWPGLDKSDPGSAISVAEAKAIDLWNSAAGRLSKSDT